MAALAQKIGGGGDVGGGSVLDDLDPETLLSSMCGFGSGDDDALMFQDVSDMHLREVGSDDEQQKKNQMIIG